MAKSLADGSGHPAPTCQPGVARPTVGVVGPSAVTQPPTSSVDLFMRRLLRLPPNAGAGQTAEKVFGASILVSTVRCVLTYVLLPLLKPVIDLSGGVGPVLGLVIGAVSATAIVFSMRRFWRANHRLRWAYTIIGGGILVLLLIQAVGDIADLL